MINRVVYSNTGLEGAQAVKNNDGTETLILKGIELLESKNDPIATQENNLTDLYTAVGGVDIDFMYSLQVVDRERPVYQEKGIGCIKLIDSNFILLRKETLSGSKTPSKLYLPNTHVRVATCMPRSILEIQSRPNSVIATNGGDQKLQTIEIPPGCVLGNIDGELRPVHMGQLLLNVTDELVVERLSEHEQQINLNTKRLDLTNKNSVLNTPVLRVTPDNFSDTSKPNPQQGMIIYNTESRSLQFYDGDDWRSLVWS